MSRDAGSAKWGRRMLRVVSEVKASSLRLTAEEGFLLSRLDGHTPWRLARDIGGMAPEEADLCVEGWLATGLLEVVGYASPAADASAHNSAWPRGPVDLNPVPRSVDESLIDSNLELSLEVQRRILEFECRLGLPPHELLEISRDADAREVKKAYFKLSREFHPDRYFRKRIDHYGSRLDRIFKKILEAHEALVKAHGGTVGEAASPYAESVSSVEINDHIRPSKLEQLRRRMPLPKPGSISREHRQKAEAFAREAERSAQLGQHQEAIISLQVAIRFDPAETKHRRTLVDLEARQTSVQVQEWMADSPESPSCVPQEVLASALARIEKGLEQSPCDAEFYFCGAWLALKVGDREKSQRFAESAINQDPSDARPHLAMGWLHRAKGEMVDARRSFQKALELDPDEMQAKRALVSLRDRGIYSAQEVCNG